MFELISSNFLALFSNPSLFGILLAVVFGAIWLLGYWPPLFKEPNLWVLFIAGAILTWVAVWFIQSPLQILTGQLLASTVNTETLNSWLLLFAVPQILLSGLVQEGSKMIPMLVYWFRSGKEISPSRGFIIGAVTGAGFAILEAQWIHNNIFASGWTWQQVQTMGFIALTPFWERFFAVGLHISLSAMLGYGLAKGRGWQVYLLVSLLHAVVNYSSVLLQTGILSMVAVEIYIAVIVIIITMMTLWRYYRELAAE